MKAPNLAAKAVLAAMRRDNAWLPAGNVEIATHLERRLRAMQDASGRNRWLHHRWVGIFEDMSAQLADHAPVRTPFNCVLIGAGHRNSLAFSALLFMAGAERIHVIEPLSIPKDEEWRITWGLQEMVWRLQTGDLVSRYFVRDASELRAFVNLPALFAHRQLTDVLASGCLAYHPTTLEDAEISSESLDLVVTRSVLEHLVDFGACFDKFARVLRSGGTMYHDVDLSSHSSKERFAFYYNPPRKGELNELRISDYLDHFERRGFRNRLAVSKSEPVEVLERSRLQSRFASYPDDDLLCSRAVIVSTKVG